MNLEWNDKLRAAQGAEVLARRSDLAKQESLIGDQLRVLYQKQDRISNKVLKLENEANRVCDAISDLDYPYLHGPINSWRDVDMAIEIIKLRKDMSMPPSEHIERLLARIEEWLIAQIEERQRSEKPVICSCAGLVNA